MPIPVSPLDPDAGFAAALGSHSRPLAGMWVCSGSPLIAELCAGSGLDWLLIDAEHTPNSLESLLAQLQAVHGYPILPVVRPPVLDPVIIKQYLDIGAQTLLVPMVDTAELADLAVRSVHYPPRGIRGVGSALARRSHGVCCFHLRHDCISCSPSRQSHLCYFENSGSRSSFGSANRLFGRIGAHPGRSGS